MQILQTFEHCVRPEEHLYLWKKNGRDMDNVGMICRFGGEQPIATNMSIEDG